MAKIFWVVCPKCDRKFYAAKDDFRFQARKRMCPFCSERFLARMPMYFLSNIINAVCLIRPVFSKSRAYYYKVAAFDQSNNPSDYAGPLWVRIQERQRK